VLQCRRLKSYFGRSVSNSTLMIPPSVIFLGSKSIGLHCLTTLVDIHRKGDLILSGVLTNTSRSDQGTQSIFHLARENGINIIEDLDDLLAHHDVDYLVSVQYHQILAAAHLKKARKDSFNLHMAPLPEYRGCNQFSFAIADQAKEFGTTLHRMSTKIDGGDILFERRFAIGPNITVRELYEQTVSESKKLFDLSIYKLIHEDYHPIPQSDFYSSRRPGFHLRKDISELNIIDVHWPAHRIDRHIRATYFPPHPGPFFKVNKKLIQVKENWRSQLKELL